MPQPCEPALGNCWSAVSGKRTAHGARLAKREHAAGERAARERAAKEHAARKHAARKHAARECAAALYGLERTKGP